MTFTEEIDALYVQYGKNIKKIKDDSTIEIFTHILKNPSKQIRLTGLKNIQIGKFYIIRYNFNGNKIWCPILTIPPVPNKREEGIIEKQLKLYNTKNILYAINFDYLPIKYKTALIDIIIKYNKEHYDKNSDRISSGGRVTDEFNFKVTWIYNFLKSNGKKNYAITAYDISKIDKVASISSTILQRFVFLDTYYINKRLMYETLQNIAKEDLREDFSKKIKMYEEILKIYEDDAEKFYKSLRNFEKNLKLIDEL